MRGSLKTQLLLAPLLAVALPTRHEVNNPHALINLDININEDEALLQETTLRLDILESTSPCGYGNVTLNGQALAQDEDGAGSGSITTESGNSILANWGFTCVHLEDEFQGQMMTFEVISIDDKEVHDVGFTVQFQQMAPVSISLINSTGSVVDVPLSSDVDEDADEQTPATLDQELAELKSMMRQLAALEYAISSKVQHISATYDFKIKRPGAFHSVSECDSLKCVVKTMYHRAKHMASKLYGYRFGDEGRFGGRPGRHHWPFHHKGEHGHGPHWFPPHHGNCSHGNHTHPHPHPHPPHHPPHGPPHHGEPPHFPHPPPFCHCAPPPPPPPHGDHPPHGHPPPPHPPSHGFPGDEPPQKNHGRPGKGFSNDMGPPEDFDADGPERPLHNEEDFPPPPPMLHHEGPPHPGHEPHGGLPPHPPHPHHPPHFGPHGPHGPHGLHGFFRAMSIIHVAAVIVLLSLLISALFTRCFAACRGHRRSGSAGCPRTQTSPCLQHDGFWATRRAAFGFRYGEIIRWMKESVRRQQLEDEEKEAIMRQIHGSESEEEDNLSTTMEQEIAQFRAVASVVGDMVEAEEGRSRGFAREIQQHSAPVPPSPSSAFPDYASTDEELPAYDEGMNDPRFVADGLRYTPGSSYTPTDSSTTGSSLDEHLGRKD